MIFSVIEYISIINLELIYLFSIRDENLDTKQAKTKIKCIKIFK